ncbi:hypothetical protein ACRAWD_16105 [Caulobacter segnis]
MWSISSLPEAHLILYSGTKRAAPLRGPRAPGRCSTLMDAAQKENAGPTAVKATLRPSLAIRLAEDQPRRPTRTRSGAAGCGRSDARRSCDPLAGLRVRQAADPTATSSRAGLTPDEREAWDAWSSAGLEDARAALGEAFEARHDAAPLCASPSVPAPSVPDGAPAR